jgi:hypothetical protein
MNIHERLVKIETELRGSCAKFKDETKRFAQNLIKELRQNGYTAIANWEQRSKIADILAWKYGIAVAMRIRDGEEYIDYLIEDLHAIVHEKDPERPILRAIIDPAFSTTPDEILQTAKNGCITILPGDTCLTQFQKEANPGKPEDNDYLPF